MGAKQIGKFESLFSIDHFSNKRRGLTRLRLVLKTAMNFDFEKTLGIIGGGQLSKMLLASAHKWGLKTHVFTPSYEDPAALVAQKVTLGSISDSEAISKWLKSCDFVTIESEFADLSSVESKKIFPSSKNLSLFRDRLTQKTALLDYKISTSPFSKLSEFKNFKKPMVFKKRLFGYDGYGTAIIKNEKAFNSFLKKEIHLDDWIAEEFVAFKRELAISIARNSKNDFCVLPLVETKQKDSKCFWVKGPIKNKRIEPFVKKAKKMMANLDYIGLLTFELFELKGGELTVNEVAPRVHNSAHYSVEALPLSQFDVHLMAVLNQNLPKKIDPHSAFSMVNLIGTCEIKAKIKASASTSLHWYGKKDNRKGRKMGHITALSKSSNKALELALKEEKRQKL